MCDVGAERLANDGAYATTRCQGSPEPASDGERPTLPPIVVSLLASRPHSSRIEDRGLEVVSFCQELNHARIASK